MSNSRTHIEIRNDSIDRELFQITEEMRNAMEQARVQDKRGLPAVAQPSVDEERNNYRAYDQNQDFFITVSKNSFLAEKHAARIIDLVVERLDLSGLYGQY